ncbi:hypothetical protein ABK040_002610 [Willaertia magna]
MLKSVARIVGSSRNTNKIITLSSNQVRFIRFETNAQVRTQQTDIAIQKFGSLKYMGMPVNVDHYNEIIYQCTVNAQSDKAKYMFDEMRAENIIPDVETFAMLIGCCLFDSNPLRAINYLEEMILLNVEIPKSFLTTVAEVLTKAGYKKTPALFSALGAKDGAKKEDILSASQQAKLEIGIKA